MNSRPIRPLPSRARRVVGQPFNSSGLVRFLETEVDAKETDTKEKKHKAAPESPCADVGMPDAEATVDQENKPASASMSPCPDVGMPDAPTTVVHFSDFGEDNADREARLIPKSPIPQFADYHLQQLPYPDVNGAADMAFSFGTSTSKPTLNLGGMNSNEPANAGNSLFGQQPASQPTAASSSSNAAGASSSQPQIDIAHLRSTTKFEQLTPELQREIEAVDTMIYNQCKLAQEVSDLLPIVIAAGEQIGNGVDFVTQKLEELETGLGNDAEAIVDARDGDLKRTELEAKTVFRAVDRLKMPRQYQASHTANESFGGQAANNANGVYGGAGLSGWWNNPQTLRGSVRGGTGAQGNTIQLPGEDAEEVQGPASLIELFKMRANGMEKEMNEKRRLLREIEAYVQGLEGKVVSKEREVNQRLAYGDRDGTALSEKAHQMQQLRYVFGEVQRNLYEVADKVGAARDQLAEVTRRDP
ncbi:hypothetical protein LTR99_010419 [Exophiala xenobiotica]|uniref:Uncharacterized protein n=1 Tax=Vermiconidia calcicola TaxID=1690605 RepID=A0AAV9PVM4_9PEZI|nr:hypothetical protein LTR92_007628 [Exophiala xenobiotica]KAK5528575.1 hypothetical protein LTR25_010188 [Vermiconidia calcicola]KAK5546000.1 hypothetical protein LTR23_003807 [Chaetothyriales sp. CCFEE 6169]KAK5267751.1 hypothetical protein LTR96_007079 [Exophiala xenobiotica]KAK5292275.1 hypothetical protein LTR99_010419 [Exophiala xenobiotica]